MKRNSTLLWVKLSIVCEFAIIDSDAELNSSAKVWFACDFWLCAVFMIYKILVLHDASTGTSTFTFKDLAKDEKIM